MAELISPTDTSSHSQMRDWSSESADWIRAAPVPKRPTAAFCTVVGFSQIFSATSRKLLPPEPGRGVVAVSQALSTESFLHTRSVAISAISR